MDRQGITELQDDSLDTIRVSFDEISSLAITENFQFDNSKLWESNGLDLLQQPEEIAQPANTQPLLVDGEYTIHFEFSNPQSEFLDLQPVAPVPSVQPVLQQTLCSEPNDIQVQPISPQQLDLPANPELFTIQVETSSPQQGKLDLLEPPASHESTADASVLFPSSVWQQGQEAASPASQQAADAPKKRRGRRKHPEGMASSSRQTRKPKLYELGPLSDKESEKKRKYAVTAKKHRDMQKAQKQKLSDDLAKTTAERDLLQQMVNQYKQREQRLLQMLSGCGIKVDALHP